MDLTRRAFVAATSSAGMVYAIARSVQAQGVPPATNQDWQRVDELLRQMTVEEKAMQLSCVVPIAVLGREGLMRGQADKLLKQGIGHIAGPGLIGHKTPETLAKCVNAMHQIQPDREDARRRPRRGSRVSFGRDGRLVSAYGTILVTPVR